VIRRGLAQLVAAVVALVVLGVLAGIGVSRESTLSSKEHQRSHVASLAGEYAVDFTSVDYRHIPAEVEATAQDATPTFAAHYRAFVTALTPIFTSGKVVQRTSLKRIGMESLTSTAAVAIVLLQRVTITTKSPAGTTTFARMRIALSKSGGRWLVSNMAQL
jgi:hypothetical protein